MNNNIVIAEKEKLNICLAYIKYHPVKSEASHTTLLIRVTDEKGDKQDWKPFKELRDVELLEKLVKDGEVKKYEVTRERMEVPRSVPLEFASIVKKRVDLEGFKQGFIYVIDK